MQKREGPEFHADSTSSSQWLYKIWNCVHEQEKYNSVEIAKYNYKKFTEENNTAITCFKNKQSRLTITKVMIQGERV